jgi:hypothetical protein
MSEHEWRMGLEAIVCGWVLAVYGYYSLTWTDRKWLGLACVLTGLAVKCGVPEIIDTWLVRQ